MIESGDVAVVTGAASGIGEALARQLALAGARLALADVDEAGLHRISAELRAGGTEVFARVTDVTRWDDVAAFADETRAAFGAVRLVVNNAGIETTGALWEISPERWEQTVGVNLNGVYFGVRAFVPDMIAAEQPATIVNIASVGALSVMPLMTPYSATKHAVLALTEGLYMELAAVAPWISVCAVLPGSVATSIFRPEASAAPSGDALRNQMAEFVAAGLQPVEAARIILAGAAAGDLWIFTDDSRADEMLTERTTRILRREPYVVTAPQ